MTFETVKRLTGFIPFNKTIFLSMGVDFTSFFEGISDPEILRFIIAYSDPAFGWKIAKTLAGKKLTFPPILDKQDQWVFKAYLYCANPDIYKNKHISEARAFLMPQLKTTRELIEALLIAGDADCKRISEYLNIPVETIECYEKLFFNIIDRRSDGAYMQRLVYPSHKLVEYFDRYSINEDLGKLLLRIGYGGTMVDVLRSSGVKGEHMRDLAIQESVQKLEASIMHQGYLFAKNGFIDQRGMIRPIRYSTQLLAAAKQGGEQTSSEAIAYMNAAESFGVELEKMYQSQLDFSGMPEYQKMKESVFE